MANKIPCKECPFTNKSLPGYLGPYKDADELHATVMSESLYVCHLTQDNTVPKLCTGALLYMRKNGKMPRDPILNRSVMQFTREDTNAVMDYVEMKRYHSGTWVDKKKKRKRIKSKTNANL